MGNPIGSATHALLWAGAAQSAIDLHPDGCFASTAWGVSAGQQVGEVLLSTSSDETHALLWTGSAESVVDLHPSGFVETHALAVAAGRQVGYGAGTVGFHALLWSGTADSVVDLHLFLPAGYLASEAHGIDAAGNVIGSATPQACLNRCGPHAILWVRQ